MGGRRSQCKQCNAAAVKSRYVPRVHPPEQVTCPQCGQEFTRIRTQGALRIYCSRKCTGPRARSGSASGTPAWSPALRLRCGGDHPHRQAGMPRLPERPHGQNSSDQGTPPDAAPYGLSQEEWDRLIALQSNACAVCKTTQPGGRGERWHIDHDHVTGQVRGLLCHQCNVGIGNLRDDPQIMMAAARYVAAHRSEAAGPKDLEMRDATAVLSHTSWPPGSG